MLGAVGATAELEEGLKPKRPSWQVGRSHTLSSNAPDTQAPRNQLKSHLLPLGKANAKTASSLCANHMMANPPIAVLRQRVIRLLCRRCAPICTHLSAGSVVVNIFQTTGGRMTRSVARKAAKVLRLSCRQPGLTLWLTNCCASFHIEKRCHRWLVGVRSKARSAFLVTLKQMLVVPPPMNE